MQKLLLVLLPLLALQATAFFWHPHLHLSYSQCADACAEIKRATFMRRQCLTCCEVRKDRARCAPKTTVVSVLGARYEDHRGPIASLYNPLYGVDQKKVYQIFK